MPGTYTYPCRFGRRDTSSGFPLRQVIDLKPVLSYTNAWPPGGCATIAQTGHLPCSSTDHAFSDVASSPGGRDVLLHLVGFRLTKESVQIRRRQGGTSKICPVTVLLGLRTTFFLTSILMVAGGRWRRKTRDFWLPHGSPEGLHSFPRFA